MFIRNCVSDGEIRNGGGKSGGFIGTLDVEEDVVVSFKNCLSSVVERNIDIIITRTSSIETVIDPEGNELDDETIRKETESLIEGSGGAVGDIKVIRKEDGLIYVTVIVPEDQAKDIAEKIGECVQP